eukprot:734733-Amphidinium_carterae.1
MFAKVRVFSTWAVLQPWVRRTHRVGSGQTGRDLQMSEASPVIADDALRKWHHSASSDSTCMTLWFGAFTLVAQVCGQVKLNINSALPLLLWNRMSPRDTTVILGDIKINLLVRTVVWSKYASLCED